MHQFTAVAYLSEVIQRAAAPAPSGRDAHNLYKLHI